MMRNEFKRIKQASKQIINKDHIKKLDKIKDENERTESLKYLIDSKLKTKLLDLEHQVSTIVGKDAWIAQAKLNMLESKIRIFNTTHKQKDYEQIEKVIKQIEKEVNNV